MLIVRQSTARTVTVGPVLDADGVAVTGGVVGDFKISKNGGAPAALNGSATLTHRHTGHYSLALTASDLDTVGQAEVVIDDTVNACPTKEITVVEEAVYDALFAASAPGYVANAPVNVVQTGGVAVTNSDFTIASATSSTVTLPTTYTDTTSLPDDDRYEFCVLVVVGGTGQGQAVLLSTAGASARQYNVLSGTMPVQLDNTSTCVVVGSWRSNLAYLNGLSGGVSRLERATRAITTGTVGSASTTTSIVTSALDPAAAATDQFKGLIVAFDKDTTTAALRGQKTDVTASTTGGILTVTNLTTAPQSGDTFTIE